MNPLAVGLLKSLFMLLCREGLKDLTIYFPYANKIAARRMAQHSHQHAGLPGEVLLCSCSASAAGLAAAVEVCQHSAAS